MWPWLGIGALGLPLAVAFVLVPIALRVASGARLKGRASTNFTYDEWLVTQTGLPNKPSAAALKNIRATSSVLERIRAKWGPLQITSGFRSPAVNSKVGGVDGSWHLQGSAVDFIPLAADRRDVFEWMQSQPDLGIDKAITYHPDRKGHIHMVHHRLQDNRHSFLYGPKGTTDYETWSGQMT